tara:strand:+ start:3811 stop:4221 length:411 start_codon:yes stop_codon:yes gene_type:complete
LLATIAFAIKILFTILCVVVLSLGKSSIITRDKVGLFSLIAIISTSLIIFSVEIDSFLIPAAFFIVVSYLSYDKFKNLNSFSKIFEKLAPYWIVILIGMTMGYGRFLQSFILTFASYYLLNYMSIILPKKKQKVEK